MAKDKFTTVEMEDLTTNINDIFNFAQRKCTTARLKVSGFIKDLILYKGEKVKKNL